jgi:hypothetical protein
MIAIELDIRFNRGEELQYGANCQCDIPSATVDQVGSAIMSMVEQTCEAMQENARKSDMIGIDSKVFRISVESDRRRASFEMTVRPTDNWTEAGNTLVDWILGDAVEEVLA